MRPSIRQCLILTKKKTGITSLIIKSLISEFRCEAACVSHSRLRCAQFTINMDVCTAAQTPPLQLAAERKPSVSISQSLVLQRCDFIVSFSTFFSLPLSPGSLSLFYFISFFFAPSVTLFLYLSVIKVGRIYKEIGCEFIADGLWWCEWHWCDGKQ